MRHPALLVTLAGIAAAPSFALPLIPAGSITDASVPHAERGPTPGAAALRGAQFPPGSIITMRDELENFPVGVTLGGTGVSAAPTSFTGPDGFDWELNNLRGQTNVNFVRVFDLAGSPVGGNATRALRLRTAAAQSTNLFYLGANLRWQHAMEPTPGADARVSAEMYISTIAEQYSFEPTGLNASFFSRRLIWGGRCIDINPGDCAFQGLPAGPITTIYSLTSIPAGFKPPFQQVRYCRDIYGETIPGCTPPPGFSIGSPVPPPIGA